MNDSVPLVEAEDVLLTFELLLIISEVEGDTLVEIDTCPDTLSPIDPVGVIEFAADILGNEEILT